MSIRPELSDNNPTPSAELDTYAAVHVVGGEIRRVWLEAPGEPDAREFCRAHNLGYVGPQDRPDRAEPAPEAYDEKAARKILGGISRATLYRMLIRGDIARLPGRRLLVTRSSLERHCRR